MVLFRFARWLFVSLFILAVGTGCGRVKRTAQCKAIVRTVNEGLSEIEALKLSRSKDPGALNQGGKLYRALSAKLSTQKVDNAVLAKTLEQYRQLLGKAEKALFAYAIALRAGDKRSLVTQRSALVSLKRQEQLLTARINAQCKAP